jgi:hypothetical protein
MSQRGGLIRVIGRAVTRRKEAHVPFLFWLPMILLSGLFSVAEDRDQSSEPPRNR